MNEASTGLEAFCVGLAAGVAMEMPRPEVRMLAVRTVLGCCLAVF
jgi:hypothetical protein